MSTKLLPRPAGVCRRCGMVHVGMAKTTYTCTKPIDTKIFKPSPKYGADGSLKNRTGKAV